MTVLVTIETIVLALMAMLLVGLLRSHAEILRRLESMTPDDDGGRHPTARTRANGAHDPSAVTVDPHLPPARPVVTPAFDVVGTTIDGDAVKVTVSTARPGGTLLAFLSTGCDTCRSFWEGTRTWPAGSNALPDDPRVVIVTKDPAFESPSKLRALASDAVPVIMSSRAWEDYRIAGSPYFVHVGPSGEVTGEGTAGSWAQVASLLTDAVEDARAARRGGTGRMSPAERLARADAELASAGIGPGHPSLYGHPVEPQTATEAPDHRGASSP